MIVGSETRHTIAQPVFLYIDIEALEKKAQVHTSYPNKQR